MFTNDFFHSGFLVGHPRSSSRLGVYQPTTTSRVSGLPTICLGFRVCQALSAFKVEGFAIPSIMISGFGVWVAPSSVFMLRFESLGLSKISFEFFGFANHLIQGLESAKQYIKLRVCWPVYLCSGLGFGLYQAACSVEA